MLILLIFFFAPPAMAQDDNPTAIMVRPQYANVRQLEPVIQSLLTSAGSLTVYDRTNSVVIRDIASNLRAIEDTVTRLDVKMPSLNLTLKYADPLIVAGNVQDILSSAGGVVLPDQRTHSLYIRAVQSDLDLVESLMPTWDKPLPQVLIEVDILDVSSAKLKELGVQWELRLGYDGGDHDAVINVNAGRETPTEPSSGSVSFGTPTITIPGVYDLAGNLVTPPQVIPGSDFSATIDALIEDSSTRTLSRPRIMVLDGHPARFEVATLEPYATTRYNESGNAASLEIEFLDIGIILETIPHINEDGLILMEIQPEISRLVREEFFETTIIPEEGGVITNRIRVPVKAQSRATTKVMVRDKQTIVIGGLKTREDFESTRKVPVLADIPILGIPFRNLNQAHDDRELVIFITPHISNGFTSAEARELLPERPMTEERE